MSVDVGEIFPIVLAQQASLDALADGRYYPNRLPIREVRPAVVFERTGGSVIPNLEGDTGTNRATFRISGWSATNQQEAQNLRNLALAIRDSRGRIGDWWVQAINVVPDSESDDPLTPLDGSDNPGFASSAEVVVFYRRGQ